MNARLLAFALLLALAACGRRSAPAPGGAPPESDRAVVTLERVEGRASPSGVAPAVRTLARGAELKILESRDGFFRVSLAKGGGEVWVEAGSFERKGDREARERRAAAVSKFAPQPGRAVESAPILLAPAYGAARWGDLEDGDDVEVILHDHDFYGIRIAGARLAFVPARSIRLLPSPLPGAPEAAPRRQIVPRVTSLGDPGVVSAPQAPAVPEEPRHAAGAESAFESLPSGAEAPEVTVRVEPVYPEAARRAGVGGEVVLRIVVEPDGTVGKVDVVAGAPMGLSHAAVEAVSRWRYRPARFRDRPIAVVKVVRVRFEPRR